MEIKLASISKRNYINAFAIMVMGFILSSCATKSWVKEETIRTITAPTQSQVDEQNKKSLLLASNTQKLMILAEANLDKIRKVTSDYKMLNHDIKVFIKKSDESRSNYLRHMGSLKKELSSKASVMDKSNQAKTLKAAKNIADKKMEYWLKFSSDVYSGLTSQYKDFHDKNKLFDLALRPLVKYSYMPLSEKTVKLLNKTSEEIVKQQDKLLEAPGKMLNNMEMQEFLFFHGALFNCRKNADILNKEFSIKISDSVWNNEGELASIEIAAKISNPEIERAFQTMLLNRVFICDVMIRRLRFSQERPLMLAYFINQMLVIDKLSKNSIWKNRISVLSREYIEKFNARDPMTIE